MMASLTPEKVAELHSLYGKPATIDDVVRLRGQDEEQVPILAYARHPDSLVEYELFTGRDVDRFVNQACWSLLSSSGPSPVKRQTVALYGESDLSYSVTMLALLRLGCRVMTISTRLGPLAARSLLEQVDCKLIMHGSNSRITGTVDDIRKELPDMMLRPMLSRQDWDVPQCQTVKPFVRRKQSEEAAGRETALIMHSSGSTGYPKPLYQCHQGILGDLLTGMGLHAFNPLPWFHLHGLLTSLQAMYMRKTAYLWNARIPITSDNLAVAMEAVKPEIFHGVPYTVKILSEHPDGVDLLKKCKHVTSGGARPPDELGELLIRRGVMFSTTFGLTETGHIGDSMRRDAGDAAWCYLRLHSHAAPHIKFVPMQEAGQYEAVFLKGHPALMMSNSDDPADSYHSGDIFVPHPSIADAWKYIARKDDCITLASGEKINPLAMEGVLRQHRLVRDALMFGVDRLVPGMLVFKAAAAAPMSREEFMATIQPALDEANGLADWTARITPDMVVVIPEDVDYPKTDKANIIRAASYKLFEERIDCAYEEARSLAPARGDAETRVEMTVPALEAYLLRLFQTIPGVIVEGVDDDLFAAGVDSLQATHVRTTILREVDARGAHLPANLVYGARTISNMARRLCRFAEAEDSDSSRAMVEANGIAAADTGLMQSLIDTYGRFQDFAERQGQNTPSQDVVVLTGATGALGAHLLHQLLSRETVRHVYCLVRGDSSPTQRVLDSLARRGIDILSAFGPGVLDKFSVLKTWDTGAANLGLGMDMYNQLRSQATIIIHAAWPVNFQIALESFRPHIAGLRNLLDLGMGVPWKTPARVLFASSVAAAMQTPRLPDGSAALVAEDQVPCLSHCLPTGYGQSKLVSERICEAYAAAGGRVAVLRIGQVVGDTNNGVWNPTDTIAHLVHSALVIGVLPLLNADQDICRWMPVDTAAAACLQAASAMAQDAAGAPANTATMPSKAIYYNLVSPERCSWNDSVLPLIRGARIQFEAVPFSVWLSEVLRYLPRVPDMAEEELPVLKLREYLAVLYGDAAMAVDFDTTKACRDLGAMRHCPQVIDDGLVGKFIRSWLARWSTGSENYKLST